MALRPPVKHCPTQCEKAGISTAFIFQKAQSNNGVVEILNLVHQAGARVAEGMPATTSYRSK
jgi:hypothetical protein